MKFCLRLIVVAASAFLTPMIAAHEGHEHAKELDRASALESASLKMVELIEEGRLDDFGLFKTQKIFRSQGSMDCRIG